MKKSIYVLAVIALTFTACKNEKKESSTMNHTKMETEYAEDLDHNDDHNHNDGHKHEHATNQEHKKTSDLTQNTTKNSTTTPIIDAYLLIKNGLVATDKNVTAKGAKALIAAFDAFDMKSLSGETHKEYMEIVENAKEQAEHIAKSEIDHQREHFEILSTDIKDLIVSLGTEKTLYQDHCPMASDGKGADWISEVKDIKNPYFGSKMLNCGSVTKQIN